jgi:adenylate kinase family enzyme
MNRIMVVGNAGAGKSTLTRRLGGKLALPVIHLDSYFWRPGWQIPDAQAWRQRLAALAALPAWVMDGNYINTFDIRMPRADGLVWLDHPRGICMRRVLMRTITGYGRTRSDLAEGCPRGWPIAFCWPLASVSAVQRYVRYRGKPEVASAPSKRPERDGNCPSFT